MTVDGAAGREKQARRAPPKTADIDGWLAAR
jgi:hypothetical protein